MKKSTKALLLTLCAVALVIGSLVGTLAYLTDSEAVTNTFTVGQVHIRLDELDVDGSTPAADRDAANTYHLLPGQTYLKDPTVTVLEGSEDAYIRMKVKVVNIDKLKEAIPADKNPAFYNGELFLLQMLCVDENGASTWDSSKWVYAGFDADTATYEFRYYTTVAAPDTSITANDDVKLPALFQKITVPGSVDNDGILKLKDVQIVVTAEAIQAAGFADANAAWSAFTK